MKQTILFSLSLALVAQGACKDTPSPAEAPAVPEIQIQEEATDSPAAEAKSEAAKQAKAQVHGGNPMAMPGQPAGKALPPGHPPLQKRMPPGHPPMGGAAMKGKAPARGPFMRGPAGPSDGHALPLETGPHSPSADMTAGKEKIQEEDLRKSFEDAFRKTFTQDRTLRDYNGAETLLTGVLAKYPKHPQSLRTMGYVAVNQGFNVKKAMDFYQQSVQADDQYGPGHYALAFMYARGDRNIGAEHYKKAISLGLPDTRQIGKSFYPHLVPGGVPPMGGKGLPPGHP